MKHQRASKLGILLTIILTACGSSPAAISPTTIPTTAPTIEPTTASTVLPIAESTSIPATEVPTVAPTIAPATATSHQETTTVALTSEDLTPLLIQPGDLPEGWTGGKVYEEAPVDYSGTKPIVVLNQGLLESGAKFPSGHIILYIFQTDGDAKEAYNQRTELIKRTVDKDVVFQNPSIGDQSFLAPGKGQVFILNQQIFLRCKSVVEIQLGKNDQVDLILNYSKRIDERLNPSVCN